MAHTISTTDTAGSTPAIVALRAANVKFVTHEFEHVAVERGYGMRAAHMLQVDPARVFKTLLATVDGHPNVSIVVGIVPVSGLLSLKELARTVGAKRATMCSPLVAERTTGYVVGGISPFGQRKQLVTVVDETCELFETIFVSGGKRGLDIEIAPAALLRVLNASVAPIGNDRVDVVDR